MAGILNMGLFPKMGATFLTYATGLGQGDAAAMSQETTINIGTSILIVLVLAYTVLGGMYWKGASSVGAMAALLGGLLSVTLIFQPKEWQARTDVNAALSLGNYAVCVALFVVFSLLFPDKRRTEEGA